MRPGSSRYRGHALKQRRFDRRVGRPRSSSSGPVALFVSHRRAVVATTPGHFRVGGRSVRRDHIFAGARTDFDHAPWRQRPGHPPAVRLGRASSARGKLQFRSSRELAPAIERRAGSIAAPLTACFEPQPPRPQFASRFAARPDSAPIGRAPSSRNAGGSSTAPPRCSARRPAVP